MDEEEILMRLEDAIAPLMHNHLSVTQNAMLKCIMCQMSVRQGKMFWNTLEQLIAEMRKELKR